jgi:F420-dependent oxidoreductase-like protein
MTLRLGISAVPTSPAAIDYVVEADRLGVDSVWVPEFWGYDALTPLGALAVRTEHIRLCTGIVQLGSRTPTMLAMSALSLQALSANNAHPAGRFVLGIGTSGPQVIEGWHGVPFARPIQRTRETIDIVRAAMAGEKVSYDGEIFQLPLPGGEGRALRSAAPPASVPIHIASLGPANLRLTGELADGWIGNSFFCPTANVFLDDITAGANAAGRTLADIEINVGVGCEFTGDSDAEVEAAGRRHAAGFAFTFGAMGSKDANFYNNAFGKQGYGDDVAAVQELWLAGDREGAGERVPIEIGLGQNLIGPPDEILRRLREYSNAGVDVLRVGAMGNTLDEQVANLGQLMDLINTVNTVNAA